MQAPYDCAIKKPSYSDDFFMTRILNPKQPTLPHQRIHYIFFVPFLVRQALRLLLYPGGPIKDAVRISAALTLQIKRFFFKSALLPGSLDDPENIRGQHRHLKQTYTGIFKSGQLYIGAKNKLLHRKDRDHGKHPEKKQYQEFQYVRPLRAKQAVYQPDEQYPAVKHRIRGEKFFIAEPVVRDVKAHALSGGKKKEKRGGRKNGQEPLHRR